MADTHETEIADPSDEGLRRKSLSDLESMITAEPTRVTGVLRALAYHRGLNALKLVELCEEGQSAAIRKLAKAVRQAILENNALFGIGPSPQIVLMPPIPTPTEASRASRWLFVTWTLGGFITITALLIREHLKMMWLPVVGAFAVTLFLFAVTRRLRQAPSSPGILTLNLAERMIELEVAGANMPRHHTWPLSDVLEPLVNEQALPTSSDEEREVTFEVALELKGGERFIIARRSDFVQAGRLRDQLRYILTSDAGEDSK